MTTLLYGDLDLKIIEVEGAIIDDKGFMSCFNCFCLEEMIIDNLCSSFIMYIFSHSMVLSSASIAIRLGDATVACAAIYRDSSKQGFKMSLAHPLPTLKLEVQCELEDRTGDKHTGVATVPGELIASAGKELEQWFTLSGLPVQYHVQVLLQIKFTPCHENEMYRQGIGKQYELRESYFQLQRGGKVTLYQDAHVCWEDIYHSILNARRLVYVVGWSVYDKVRLVRDPTRSGEATDVMTLGELLKSKSKEKGLRVELLLWEDKTSNVPFYKRGYMQTHGKRTMKFFSGSGVNCRLASRNPAQNNLINNWIYSHHQKCVIVDQPGADGDSNMIVAFLGGLDLTHGRYDTPDHRLFCNHDTLFDGDYHNPFYKVRYEATTRAPRQPWHDLHCKIEGSAAYDVLTNFQQRWQEATKESGNDLLNNKSVHNDNDTSSSVPHNDDPESWHVQVFRSLDSSVVNEFSEIHDKREKGLVEKQKLVIDRSIQMAYIQAIRSAQHFIYIENQYFLGPSYASNSEENNGVNFIPLELALKIASKIKAKERFSVYVVIPMWPEGNPSTDPQNGILHLQWKTMQMMYNIIAQEIKSSKLQDARLTDYLNFYCLGNRERPLNLTDVHSPKTFRKISDSSKHGRFMIYVHSKGMIIDDAYVIIGSANINQRSMDGSRDTEIAVGAYQPHYTWSSEESHPHGQINRYRMSLWEEHLGKKDEIFEEPENLDCVKYVNRVAEDNWNKFIDNKQFTKLQGHILKYPVEVDVDGNVKSLPDHNYFPDVGGKVLGKFGNSFYPIELIN